MTGMETLIGYLRERFRAAGGEVAVVADRISAEFFPDHILESLRTNQLPAIRIRSKGGMERSGYLAVDTRMFDIYVVGGRDTLELMYKVLDALTDILERFRDYPGVPARIKSAVREDGPTYYEDDEYRWPVLWTVWTVCFPFDPPARAG